MGVVGVVGKAHALSTYRRLTSNCSFSFSASDAADCADLHAERSKVNAVAVTGGASTGGDGARRGSGGSGGSWAIVYTEYVLQAGLHLQLAALCF